MELHLTTDNANAIKWFSRPNLKGCRVVNGLYMIEMYKNEVEYDKPCYVGTSVLDVSKLCMMRFHYNVIEKTFPGSYDLIYSDTDSFVYDIRCPDVYDWVWKQRKHFDLSESLREEVWNDENKKVLGKMKDECRRILMTEFIAPSPKVYSILYQELNKTTKEVELKNKKAL
jgi:hypothetical protein